MNLMHIGLIFILLGFLLLFIGSLQAKEVKFAVGGFVGPFPFGFANDPKLFLTLLIISAVILIILMVKIFT